jgi:hypothetical protein
MAPRKKSIDLEDYTALDAYSICLHEWFKSLKRAGFSDSWIVVLLTDKEAYPDWILPKFPEKLGSQPYEDDEED